ncbi:hypothetical protein BHE74_00036848 [Ensete ventricosum]|nr:hypothetical protein BHE74_00036848 [Ensete ventricosum]
MIAPTKEPKLEDTTLKPKEKDTPQSATRMVPTLADYTNLQKLKIEGFLEQQSVIILIDAGSTHNFMSIEKARLLDFARLLKIHSCINPKSLTFGYLDEKPIDTDLMKFLGLYPSALSWYLKFASAFSTSSTSFTTNALPP